MKMSQKKTKQKNKMKETKETKNLFDCRTIHGPAYRSTGIYIPAIWTRTRTINDCTRRSLPSSSDSFCYLILKQQLYHNFAVYFEEEKIIPSIAKILYLLY